MERSVRGEVNEVIADSDMARGGCSECIYMYVYVCVVVLFEEVGWTNHQDEPRCRK
jgi:hypothetical protein